MYSGSIGRPLTVVGGCSRPGELPSSCSQHPLTDHRRQPSGACCKPFDGAKTITSHLRGILPPSGPGRQSQITQSPPVRQQTTEIDYSRDVPSKAAASSRIRWAFSK